MDAISRIGINPTRRTRPNQESLIQHIDNRLADVRLPTAA